MPQTNNYPKDTSDIIMSNDQANDSDGKFKRFIRSLAVKGIYYLELIASFLVVAVAVVMIIKIVIGLFVDGSITTMNIDSFSTFLSDMLTITVGLEFVKLLAQQRFEDIVEVIMLAIARQMVVSHYDMKQMLFGVIAIVCLFAINKFIFGENGSMTNPFKRKASENAAKKQDGETEPK
ncbi:MAG: hypothetical protein ACOYJO_02170 [Eubacterium sp.]|jgi:hypothetical protein